MAGKLRRESPQSKAFKSRQLSKEAKVIALPTQPKKDAKGKASTKAKAKASTAAPKKPTTSSATFDFGDNGPKARDFAHHLQTCAGLTTKKDESVTNLRNAYNRAKEAGIDPAVIKKTITDKKKDPLALQTFMKQLRAAYSVAGIEVQMDMFNEGTISRPAQIYDDGYKAGFAATGEDKNPHDANTKAGQRWLAGYNDGQADLSADAFQGRDSLNPDGTKDSDDESKAVH